MKYFTPLLLLSALYFLLLSPTVAEESYNYTFEIVKCPKTPAKRLLSKKDWQQFLNKSGAVVLDTVDEDAVALRAIRPCREAAWA